MRLTRIVQAVWRRRIGAGVRAETGVGRLEPELGPELGGRARAGADRQSQSQSWKTELESGPEPEGRAGARDRIPDNRLPLEGQRR